MGNKELLTALSSMLDEKLDAEILSKKVETTYQLALDAWGTGTENRKWLQQVFRNDA